MDILKKSGAQSSAPATPRQWGRWRLTDTPPFGLIIELGDDVIVGVDFISLRDEWGWKSQEIASTPGITQQDMADIEQARADLGLIPEPRC